MTIYHASFASTLGEVLLTSDGRALTGFYFEGQKDFPRIGVDWIADDDAPPFLETRRQYAEYERGERDRFDLPLALLGTPFQVGVWNALLEIGYGSTISYGELARRVGAPTAARAVGAAVGRNPVSVIVPCHRIVGSSGSLTGYAGGIERKRALLTLEGVLLA